MDIHAWSAAERASWRRRSKARPTAPDRLLTLLAEFIDRYGVPGPGHSCHSTPHVHLGWLWSFLGRKRFKAILKKVHLDTHVL